MSLESRIAVLEKRFSTLAAALQELRRPSRNAVDVSSPSCSQLQPCARDTPRVAEVRRWCLEHKLHSAQLAWVPSDYYSHSLQWRRDILKADSISHLCKTILLENTHCTIDDCSNPKNSRYYMVLFQYVEKFDAELVMRTVKNWNENIGKKKFNFRLASSETSEKLTGFTHGAVVPFCTPTSIPLIMSSAILDLSPPYIWVGAGHQDCKLRVDVQEFIEKINPEIASFTTPLSEEELSRIAD